MTATLPTREPTRSPGSRGWWAWFALSSLAITVLAVGPYATASLAQLAADDHGVASNYADRAAFFQGALYVHAGAAGLALLLSPSSSQPASDAASPASTAPSARSSSPRSPSRAWPGWCWRSSTRPD